MRIGQDNTWKHLALLEVNASYSYFSEIHRKNPFFPLVSCFLSLHLLLGMESREVNKFSLPSVTPAVAVGKQN